MKNGMLKPVALLIAFAALFAAAACKSGGGASSAAPESVSSVSAEESASPRSVDLAPVVDDGSRM